MDDTVLRDPGGPAGVPSGSGEAAGGGPGRHRGPGEADGGAVRRPDRRRDPGGGGGPVPPLPAQAPHPGHHRPGAGTGASGRPSLRPGAGLPRPHGGGGEVRGPGQGGQHGGGGPAGGRGHHCRGHLRWTPGCGRHCGSCCSAGAPWSAVPPGRRTLSTACTTTSSSPCPGSRDHLILAIDRGEREGALKVKVDCDREEALVALRRRVVRPGSAAMDFIKAAAEDAYDRLLFPSLEREIAPSSRTGPLRGPSTTLP